MSSVQNILDTSTQLFMRLGVRSVSMDDVSKELGISKKTLYQFITNKEDLVDKCIHKHIEEEQKFMDNLKRNATDAVDEIAQLAQYLVISFKDMKPSFTFDLQKYYPNIWRIVQRFHEAHVKEIVIQNIQKGLQEGLYRKDIDPEVISALYLAKTWAVVDGRQFDNTNYNAEHIILQHLKYHLHGVLSEKGRERLRQYKLFEK